MSNTVRIHIDKTPKRLHYIVEWADKRNLRQADIVDELGADKSVVSRWFSGNTPSEKWLEPLAALLGTTPTGLFQHPDDDWIARFFRDKTDEQREKAISMLKLMFESLPKTGTND